MQGALGVSLWSAGFASARAATDECRTFAAYLDTHPQFRLKVPYAVAGVLSR